MVSMIFGKSSALFGAFLMASLAPILPFVMRYMGTFLILLCFMPVMKSVADVLLAGWRTTSRISADSTSPQDDC